MGEGGIELANVVKSNSQTPWVTHPEPCSGNNSQQRFLTMPHPSGTIYVKAGPHSQGRTDTPDHAAKKTKPAQRHGPQDLQARTGTPGHAPSKNGRYHPYKPHGNGAVSRASNPPPAVTKRPPEPVSRKAHPYGSLTFEFPTLVAWPEQHSHFEDAMWSITYERRHPKEYSRARQGPPRVSTCSAVPTTNSSRPY